MSKQKRWGREGDENLSYEDPSELLIGIVSSFDDNEILKKKTFEVYEFEAVDITFPHVLVSIIDDLDEEYGDPDGELSEITDRMRKAETEFLKIIKEEYEPWAMTETGESVSVTFNSKEDIKKFFKGEFAKEGGCLNLK